MTRIGYFFILLAMVVYALAGLFLDYYPMGPGDSGITLFESLAFTRGLDRVFPVVIMGGILTAFGGPLLIAVLSLLGLVGRRYSPARSTVVAVATWSTVLVGTTIRLAAAEFRLGAGFWVQAMCVGVAILGALMLLTRRGALAEPGRRVQRRSRR